jgi:hypothetical protein
MTIAVTFEITAKEGVNVDNIATRLKNMGLGVLDYTPDDVGTKARDPRSVIMCTFLFPETEAVGLKEAQENMLKRMHGVEDAQMVHSTYQRAKKKWYDHFIIPLIISTAVYSLGVLGALLNLSREFKFPLDWMIYLLYLAIPAISSFLIGVSYTRYRHII